MGDGTREMGHEDGTQKQKRNLNMGHATNKKGDIRQTKKETYLKSKLNHAGLAIKRHRLQAQAALGSVGASLAGEELGAGGIGEELFVGRVLQRLCVVADQHPIEGPPGVHGALS